MDQLDYQVDYQQALFRKPKGLPCSPEQEIHQTFVKVLSEELGNRQGSLFLCLVIYSGPGINGHSKLPQLSPLGLRDSRIVSRVVCAQKGRHADA